MKFLSLRNIFTLLLFAVFLVFVIFALDYPRKASLGPLAAGIPGLILLLVVFIQDNLRSKTKMVESKEDKERTALTFRDYREAILWILGLLILSYLFGMIPIFTLFVLVYIKVKGFSWRTAIIVAACVFAVMYGGYKVLLQSPLYEGLIFEKLF